MPFVDERVTKILAEAGAKAPVLIVCEDDCDRVATELMSQNILVDKAGAELGVIRIVVDAASLETVKQTAGISAIEPDEDVQAQ